MRAQILGTVALLLCFAGYAAAGQPHGSLYLEGKDQKVGVILAHGQGEAPDSKVVDPLRWVINKELGFTTLSLQMPVIKGQKTPDRYKDYAPKFPEAYATIREGIEFLRNEKKVERIYLMGYSMGARMTTAYLAENPDSSVAGFIGVGMLGGGEAPLNANINLKKMKMPVLDIYAENDLDAKSAEFRKPMISATFKQVMAPGARHDYDCCMDLVKTSVVQWLREREASK